MHLRQRRDQTTTETKAWAKRQLWDSQGWTAFGIAGRRIYSSTTNRPQASKTSNNEGCRQKNLLTKRKPATMGRKEAWT